MSSVWKAVTKLSSRANVKVSEKDGKPFWASPHDFRRSFGSRWAKRVMPAVLMRLMRHRSLTTTMQYYAVNDAESVAEAAYAAISGDNFGDTSVSVNAKPPEFQSF